MARVTVEDCLENVKNRFELVMLASKRARQLMRGSSEPKVAWENDKATVVALREIAMGYTDFSDAHHADLIPSIPSFLSQPLESSKPAEPEMTEIVEIVEVFAEPEIAVAPEETPVEPEIPVQEPEQPTEQPEISTPEEPTDPE